MCRTALATRLTLTLERYSAGQPSRFAIEGSRSAASHLPIVSCDEAIRKTAAAILPTKQSFRRDTSTREMPRFSFCCRRT